MRSFSERKLLIVDVAGLGYDLLTRNNGPEWQDLVFQPVESVFPAVTCTVQASFRTALPPSQHGMVANGVFLRDLHRPLFWEQSAGLVEGARIWESFRKRGKRVGMLFWQQSLGENVDIALSPAPIHKHGGGMIDDCFGKPADLYPRLCNAVGRRFRLMRYWGPLASAKVGDWIAEATAALLADAEVAPDLCFLYLPTLDYALQRSGPESKGGRKAFEICMQQLQRLLDSATEEAYEVLIFGDYAMGEVNGAAEFPNRALAEKGLMTLRRVGRALYPDFYYSRAFAMVDHEVAHVYVRDQRDKDKTKDILAKLQGVEDILDGAAQHGMALDHPRSGELVIVARPGHWFAYPWWADKTEAPDYAGHVDIHNKPGFDPCELFFGWPPGSVSRNTGRIRGTHGRTGEDRKACWASTFTLDGQPKTLIELSSAVRSWLEEAP